MNRLRSAAARLIIRCAMRLTPPTERGWMEAMRAEMAHIEEPTGKLIWAVGALVAALRIRATLPAGRFDLICLTALTLLTLLDWSSADPAPTVLALVATPAILANAEPDRARQLGLLFALWVLGTHVLADLSAALRPSYQHLPLTVLELAEIAFIACLTIPSAWLGAQAARRRA